MKFYSVLGFVLVALTQCTWGSPTSSGDPKDTLALCPPCTLEFRPICGSDGKTYPNRCNLECHQRLDSNLKIVKEGDCESTCICPFDYKPVCGSDRKTYSNECSFRCAQRSKRNLEITHTGVCPTKVRRQVSNNCICTRNIEFVCGTDGKTYSNPCVLNCARGTNRNLAIAHLGQCDNRVQVEQNNPDFKAVCICNRNFKPVCGSDGQTYSNECLLRCKQATTPDLQEVRRGPCGNRVNVVDNNSQVQVVDGDQYRPGCGSCTRDLKPVCGTDGKTYSNECVMRCTSSDPAVNVARYGRC